MPDGDALKVSAEDANRVGEDAALTDGAAVLDSDAADANAVAVTDADAELEW